MRIRIHNSGNNNPEHTYLLNLEVSVCINIGRGLVHQDNLGRGQDRPDHENSC
jgi:hypothetical protein